MKVCVTGSAGFIMGYVVEELLRAGYEVVGIDNFSKYGAVVRSFDNDPRYQFITGDVKDAELLKQALASCDFLIAGAAKIGGISYFHEYAYDLLAENERIVAASFDAAPCLARRGGPSSAGVNWYGTRVEVTRTPKPPLSLANPT